MDSTSTLESDKSSSLAHLRRDYQLASLDESQVASDPILQFDRWLQEAQQANLLEPNAMTLATVASDGRPSARIVLLKGFDATGFCFYTNYLSRKGVELLARPQACLVFLWKELERQVRIEGCVEKMSEQESDLYFHSRPLNSRYGACVSPQSQVIVGRQGLIDVEEKLRAQYGDSPPRPKHWGGYRLKPDVIEFWQGRRSRLHDRLSYHLSNSSPAHWTIERLAP